MLAGQDVQSRNLLPQVHFALPAPALRPLITTYYAVVTLGPMADHLHPEWANLRFTLSGEWMVRRPGCTDPTPPRFGLFGPSDRTALVATPGPARMAGAGLTALGWSRLIREPAKLHANRVSPLSGTIGARADGLHRALCAAEWPAMPPLLDEFFSGLADEAPPADPMVTQVEHALLHGDLDSVADFAAGLALSERSLERLCNRAFGFSPKRLLRRQRFLRTLAQIGDRLDQPLSVLLDGSYFDQSHFIREFRAYMGMTPMAYYHSPRQMMRRAGMERLRTAGAPVQGLHQP
jgi:AraC-like DNA-binding protein